MDQPSVSLDEAREHAGWEVLRILDDLGFDMQAAGWIYMEDANANDEEWRLYLITEMIDLKGPRWVYERLLKAFAKVGLPDAITPLDIYVAGPKDGMFELLRKVVATNGDRLIAFDNINISDQTSSLAARYFAFYRIRKERVVSNPNLFAKRVENLIAA